MTNRPGGELRRSRRLAMKACDRRGNLVNRKDLISTLPDDVLLHILSFLTMQEAGSTSLLSKRWRYVWAYIPTLNLCSPELDDTLWPSYDSEVDIGGGHQYVHWVDQVVNTHKAPTIDEFRVGFRFGNLTRNLSSIDKWFRFAMEKRVKILEVDLSQLVMPNYYNIYHTFPSLSFSDRLTSLKLDSVDLTDEILESFLCNCPALECLSVKYSTSLVELTVTGPSLKLKFLRISDCDALETLEIAAPNLVTLHYYGHPINVELNCAPKLREVSIGQEYCEDLNKSFSDLSNCVSQIEVLCLAPDSDFEIIRLPVKDHVFTSLKMLELIVAPRAFEEFECLKYLIKASPFLHNFKLMISRLYSVVWYDMRNEVLKPEAFPHHHLKIVEIVGFGGRPIDFAIATFLIECAVSLDKFIVDPREVQYSTERPVEFKKTPEIERSRMLAGQLGGMVKLGTKLEIG